MPLKLWRERSTMPDGLEPVIGEGRAFYGVVCAQDLEVVAAKRLGAPYRIVEPLASRKVKTRATRRGSGAGCISPAPSTLS
jgi:hypothetical protein